MIRSLSCCSRCRRSLSSLRALSSSTFLSRRCWRSSSFLRALSCSYAARDAICFASFWRLISSFFSLLRCCFSAACCSLFFSSSSSAIRAAADSAALLSSSARAALASASALSASAASRAAFDWRSPAIFVGSGAAFDFDLRVPAMFAWSGAAVGWRAPAIFAPAAGFLSFLAVVSLVFSLLSFVSSEPPTPSVAGLAEGAGAVFGGEAACALAGLLVGRRLPLSESEEQSDSLPELLPPTSGGMSESLLLGCASLAGFPLLLSGCASPAGFVVVPGRFTIPCSIVSRWR
mmetsp:Transcript_29412/g.57592  ORF Transcript_29412/g.57592 Transcript_29412/m.57592 type:complete len:290 (+) Transcript_29412:1313-2182(+)